MKSKMMVAVLAMGVIALGVLTLVLALGPKIARWAGLADSLPVLGLVVLYVAGHMVVTAMLPKRSRVLH